MFSKRAINYHMVFEAKDAHGEKHLFNVMVDLHKAGMAVSDHRCVNQTFNMWAPGTPRTDRSLQQLLPFIANEKRKEITEVAAINEIDLARTKVCRLDGATTIQKHLYLVAKEMMRALQGQHFVALQEVPDPMTYEPFQQFKYLMKMLETVNRENKYFTDDEMKQLLMMFELSYMRKHKVFTTQFGHAMLVNPKFIKQCIRLESPDLQYEDKDHLRAHLYLLTKLNGEPFMVANAHSDFVTALATIQHTKFLADQGIIVCGDVNISPAFADHAEACAFIQTMLASGRYLFATDLADGKTYDIHVRLQNDKDYQVALQETLSNVKTGLWKQIGESFAKMKTDEMTRSYFRSSLTSHG